MTVPHPSGQGSTTVPVPADLRLAQALPDDLVRELCAIGQRIEDHYGFPQDIEWGWADGRFAILQAREITGADLDFGHELEAWKTPKALADMYDERWTLVTRLLRRGADGAVDAVVLHLPPKRNDEPQGESPAS